MRKSVLLILLNLTCILGYSENYPYRSDVLWLTTPNHNNWLYQLNEPAEISINLYHYGILQDSVQVEFSIGPDMLPADTAGTILIKNGQGKLEIGTMSIPGFRDCRLKTKLNNTEYQHHIKVGFAPEQLQPYTQLPADFNLFWDKAKEEASKCPDHVETTFVPEYSSDKIDCYLVKLQVVKKGSFVYGYLTRPKAEGKYPIVFSPPGAGIKPMNPSKDLFYAENGFIRFDMEIHGIRPDLDAESYKEISSAFGTGNNSYLVNGLDNKDSYYMKKVYLACVRAIDYLTTLTEWDGKNVIAQGGSQGGALALITTALDQRVTLCAAHHPALSDMAGYKYNRAGGYPHLFTKFDGMDTPDKLETLAYYDVVNFARHIDVPVFLSWGYNDNTCPPTTSYIVANTIKSQKDILITPVNEHWISQETRTYIMEWIKINLQ